MQKMILEIPRLSAWFQFSEENVRFTLICIVAIAGILMCFEGYRYFKIMAFMLIGCLCGKMGYTLGTQIASSSLWQMYIFVACILGGIGLAYLISLRVEDFLQKDNKKIALQKRMVVLSPILGALILGGLVYTRIYNDLAVAIAVIAVFITCGMLWGRKNYENRRKFYTYDDLINMK